MSKYQIIMFPHIEINKELNNEKIKNLYDCNYLATPNILFKNIHMVILLIKKIKNIVYPILQEYSNIVNKFNIQNNEIIINYFNINYFYKLLIVFLKKVKIMKKLFIKNDIFEVKYIQNHIKIILNDLNTKIYDIY